MRSDGKFKNFDSPLDVDHDEDSAKVNNATVVAKFKHEQGTIGKVYYNIHKDNFYLVYLELRQQIENRREIMLNLR